jgi:hypothetical protein
MLSVRDRGSIAISLVLTFATFAAIGAVLADILV